MPRYTLTPEEFALVEKARVKNASNLGYNEGLENAAIQVLVYSHGDHNQQPSDDWRAALVTYLRSLKREITL